MVQLSSNLYFAFDAVWYLLLGVSGLTSPDKFIDLFKLPPTIYKHDEINEFLYALLCVYANMLAVVSIAQSFSHFLAFRGDDQVKRTVTYVNVFLNVLLASAFWYNIHYAHNPKDDVSEHLLFKEQGISAIWINNIWAIVDSLILLYVGVYKRSRVVAPTSPKETQKIKNK